MASNRIPRLLALFAIPLVACGKSPPSSIRFVDVTRAAGLERTTPTYAVAAADIDGDGAIDLFVSNHRAPAALYRNLGNGRFQESPAMFEPGDLHGASWLDWNGDGLLDLFVAVGANWGSETKRNRLYQARAGGGLELVDPGDAVVDPTGRGRAGCPLDLDGDDRPALLILNERPGSGNRLVVQHDATTEDVARRTGLGGLEATAASMVHLTPGAPPVLVTDGLRVRRRNADGRFVDVTRELGLPLLDSVQAVAIGDYDNDGDLDLFAVQGWLEPGGAVVDGVVDFTLPLRPNTHAATRLRARGEITLDMEDAGPGSPPGSHPEILSLGSTRQRVAALPWRGRVDAPELAGRPRLDPRTDAGVFLWRDDDGTLVLDAVGAPHPGIVRGHLAASEGIEVVQTLDTDKRPRDLRSRLFENRGGTFVDVTDRAGITTAGYGHDAVFADLDDDGDLDLYVVNGGERGRNPPDVLYRNDGNGTFTDVTAESATAGPTTGTGDGVVAFDYDGDGRLDLFTTNGHGAPPFDRGPYWLGQNHSQSGGSVEVTLIGGGANRVALGTQVRAETAGRVLAMERYGCNGSRATSVLPLHIGLGTATETNLVVTWPSGRETRHVLAAGARARLVEPTGRVE